MLFTSSRVLFFFQNRRKKIFSRFYLSMGSRYHQPYANYAAIISHLISSEETRDTRVRVSFGAELCFALAYYERWDTCRPEERLFNFLKRPRLRPLSNRNGEKELVAEEISRHFWPAARKQLSIYCFIWSKSPRHCPRSRFAIIGLSHLRCDPISSRAHV